MKDATGQLIPVWKVFWMVFGTSNQLLAALTLLTITVWRKRSRKSWWFIALPTVFMLVMTLWSLGLMIQPWAIALRQGRWAMDGIAIVAVVLIVLALLVLTETIKSFSRGRNAASVAG